MTLTRDEQEALHFAARSCFCESYYNFTCGKCRAEPPKATEKMVAAGFVTWGGYSGPNITDAGRTLLAALAKGGDDADGH